MTKGQCKANWESPNNPPEYEVQIGGNPFVCVLLKNSEGSVLPGDYTNGRWFVCGVQVDEKQIDGWCYYPEP